MTKPDEAIEAGARAFVCALMAEGGNDGALLNSYMDSPEGHLTRRAMALAYHAILKVIAEPDAEMVEAGERAFLNDMRGRKFLKWLFDRAPSNIGGGIGYVDAAIDIETQSECARTNSRASYRAMIHKLMGGGE